MFQIVLAAIAKAAIYTTLFRVAAQWWPARPGARWLRSAGAGLARVALGWVVGLPMGIIFADRSSSTPLFYALYFTLRFLLWSGVAFAMFREVTMARRTAFALAALLLNWLLDTVLLPEGLAQAFSIRIC